jgi:glycosyltransferase involved in cell wall biosynthesis
VKIVFLWSDLNGYVQVVINQLLNIGVDEILIFHWNKISANSSQYKYLNNDKIKFINREGHSVNSILEKINDLEPEIIVVSGWMDNGYIRSIRTLKNNKNKAKIVAGIDDQWFGSIRQYLGTIYYKLFYRKLFDYMWVSGKPQFSFAQKFGYSITEIISNLYCGNFYKSDLSPIFNSTRFIYVGRLMHSKGVDLIIKAHKSLDLKVRLKWPLYIIGKWSTLRKMKKQLR